MLRDPATFSSQVGGANLEELDAEQLEVRRSMLETDGDRHRALRRLLQDEFTPKVLAGYEAFLRGLARATVDAALAKPAFDVVKDVSADFPINVLARLLDVPAEHTGQLIAWGNRMIGNSDPDYADVLADSAESEQYRLLPFRSPAAVEVFEYGLELADAAPRRRPATTWSAGWSTGCRSTESPLDERDLRNYFLLLVVAGNETTRHALSHTIAALLDNPGQLALLRADPALIAPAVEEFLRWASPVYHFRRTATRDVELHGRRSGRATRSSCGSRRPTATSGCSTTRTVSTCCAAASTTSPSARAARTSAWATSWRGWS